MNIDHRLIRSGINHRSGRRADVAGICIHVTEGSAASVLSWFNAPEAQVSAHYMVQADGTTVQFVSEADEAWAQGRVDHPTAKIVLDRPGVNPNSYLISIEHEGDGTKELTDKQRAASIALIRDIASRHGLPIDRYHVVGHHEIYSLKTCPGAINVDRLVRDAVELTATGFPLPDPPLVWSDYYRDWLIVTRVTSDREWEFVPVKQVRAGPGQTKAQTLLSSMPTRRPT